MPYPPRHSGNGSVGFWVMKPPATEIISMMQKGGDVEELALLPTLRRTLREKALA
ncbi:MAG: hypothetical protein H7099_03275 [Gemmatimonadaceae bacterium]|nr:hypothetical protein [Gemmatimonadaceae bacterium]